MTEEEFLATWQADKPLYQAWGNYIKNTIVTGLIQKGCQPDLFLKLPASVRLKADKSLVDKAFYRRKQYEDPYANIEDKVGVRFVVLLNDDIGVIHDIIQSHNAWDAKECKNYLQEREENPLLFTYQSLHFVVRPKEDLNLGEVVVTSAVVCEVQVRTLLQHAHAELTHDTIYKPKKMVQPLVERTAAKSMALIETADDLFTLVVESVNAGPIKDHNVVNRLDELYKSLTGREPITEKATLILLDEYETDFDGVTLQKIEQSFTNNDEFIALAQLIKEKVNFHQIYQQSIVLFIYWKLKKNRRSFRRRWPFDKRILEILAADAGAALERR